MASSSSAMDRVAWSNLVQVATCDAQREAIYRLRYSVYVQEVGKPYPAADHAGGRLHDCIDAESLNLFAMREGEMVGAFRGTFDLAIFQHCDPWSRIVAQLYRQYPDRRKIALASRLVVAHQERGRTRTAVALMCALYYFAREDGVDLCVCHTSERHLRLCARMGWRPFGQPFFHADSASVQIPLVLDVLDAAYMGEVQSPLTAEALARL